MIVQHGQRVQPASVQGHMALEVHLPQLVRSRPLEPGVGALTAAMRAQFDTVALQNRRHRRGDRNCIVPQILQPPGDLAAAPGRMLGTQRKHGLLGRRNAARGRILRPARQLLKPSHPVELPTFQPFVAGRRADPEPAAKPPNIGSFHRRQHHKLQSRVHTGSLVERHPTASLIRCRKCPRCLRTPVHHVPV